MDMNLSDDDIERQANRLRDYLKLDYVFVLDMETVIKRLSEKSLKFHWRGGRPEELCEAEAFMDCETQTMLLSQDVIRDLAASGKRAKFTVAHELGHFILGHRGNTARHPDKSKYLTPMQKLQEMQADKFASHFLLPNSLIPEGSTASELVARFQVNLQVAEIALKRFEASQRRKRGEKRRPPASVISYLEAAERRGYKIKSDVSEFRSD